MDGTTVVVTGASRGLGRAIAQTLHEAGAHVVICSRESDDLQDVVDERSDRGSVTAMRADVRDEFDLERLMERAAAIEEGIDGVVANAAIDHEGAEPSLLTESYAAFDDHLRTNTRGVLATMREARPHLTPAARLLIISCVQAREPETGGGSYGVSKAAAEAIGFRLSAQTDYVVGIVDPGPIATGLATEGGSEPAVAAEQVSWALSVAPPEAIDGRVLTRADWEQRRDHE